MASYTPAAAIESRLRTEYTDNPIYLWSEVTDAPAATLGPFLVLEFPGGTSEQMSIGAPGSNWWEENGGFMVHIFVPLGSHDLNDARQIAETVAAIFRGQEFSGVVCRAPNPPQPMREDKAVPAMYAGLSIFIPYYYRLRA